MRENNPVIEKKSSNKTFDVECRGKHLHFKVPYYGISMAISKLASEQHTSNGTSNLAQLTEMLPFMCALIGSMWDDGKYVLDNKFPFATVNSASLLTFGENVSIELQDTDFNLLDILDIFNTCSVALKKSQSILEMASERASFLPAQQANSTSN